MNPAIFLAFREIIVKVRLPAKIFLHSFEWFCLQVTDAKYFSSLVHCDQKFWYNCIACTTALLPTKPSSDDDSRFEAEAPLPLAQSAPAVSHDTTRLCQIVITLWYCHYHADAVRALSWIFSMYFLLSDEGSLTFVKNAEVELAMKPLHPTSTGNAFVIQPFLSHCSRRSSYFFQLTLRCPVEIFFKKDR